VNSARDHWGIMLCPAEFRRKGEELLALNRAMFHF
jgi:hypothetical protein